MVEEISKCGAVQLIKPTKFESDEGEILTKFELQTDVLDQLLNVQETVPTSRENICKNKMRNYNF